MTHSFISSLNYRKILLLQAIASAATLGAALVSQYGFLLHPCELCLMQRYPYVAIMVVAFLAAWRVKKPYYQMLIALFCVALFALDAGIAFYHTGVELDIFKGPDACSNSADSGEQTLEEMRAAILNAPLVSCKQAMAYFMGISMAAWNGLAASFYILASLLGCIYVRRKNA